MRTIATYCISLGIVLGSVVALSGSCPAQEQERQRTFRLENEELRNALDSLMQWYDISIVYFDSHVSDSRVTSRCVSCTAVQALNQVLDGTGLMWIRMGNQFVLRPRPESPDRVTAVINGVVSDSLTGGWIAGATVLLCKAEAGAASEVIRWCPTNSFGFYSLPDVEPGEYVLTVRTIGYAPGSRTFGIDSRDARRVDLSLRQEEIFMQEFTVEGHRTESTPGGGLVRGTYIRSVPSDQTQYLLDGARIYNPSHFGGVLATFQPDVLNDVESETSGLSPFYGGRIGGLLDLSIREGTQERIAGSAGMGSLGTHLLVEGPIGDRSTFLVSGRRAYVDPAVPFLRPDAATSRSGSYEIVGKANYRLAGNSRLFLSGYLGGDTYANSVEGGGGHLNNVFDWSNSNLQCRWFGISSSSLFLYGSIGYSRHDLSLDHELTAPWTVEPSTSYSSNYRIEDMSLRAHAEHFLDREHTIRGGVELNAHRITGHISEFSLANAPVSFRGYTFGELALYLQDQWRITDGLTAELGARATSFMGEGGTRSGVDPRFSLIAALDENTRLYGSLTAINQFIHPYRNTGVFFFYPTVFWYPTTSSVKPTTALQITVGAERGWGADAYLAGAEAYYRVTHDYHGYTLLAQSGKHSSLGEALIYGTEHAYGGSITMRKRFGVFTGSLRYTLSWLRDTFAEINNGEPFAPAFDRRHELELWATYSPGDDWTVGAVCVLASEPPLVTAASPISMNIKDTADPSQGPTYSYERSLALDANGSKTPGFQRLEISVMKRVMLWGVSCQFSLRMLNAYGLLDPFVWTLNGSPNSRTMWTAELRELTLFPLYPSVGMNIRF